MKRRHMQPIAGVLVGLVCFSLILPEASACRLFRRWRCRPCSCDRCAPCETACSTPSNGGSPPSNPTPPNGPGGNPPADPTQLPELSDVPADPPELIIPDGLMDLPEATTEEATSQAAAENELFVVRTWTHRDGRTCVAKCIGVSDDSIQLDKAGVVYAVPIEWLSSADAALVTQHNPIAAIAAR